jgi:NAD(P)-dependent dehydrogenase (short-subunit alcohol dehydrogenase family)
MAESTARDCKSVIVTGGSGMIGRATVERLAASGCDVLAVDVNAAALAVLEKASSTGRRISTFVADVVDPAQVAAATARAQELFGTIDGLVNVAGGAGPTEAFEIESIDTDVWDHVIALNVRSTFLFCRAVVPLMRREGFGRIVVLSSSAARGSKGPQQRSPLGCPTPRRRRHWSASPRNWRRTSPLTASRSMPWLRD